MSKFTLTFDPAVDEATQAYAEQLVSDYVNAKTEADALATFRAAPVEVVEQVLALAAKEKARQVEVAAVLAAEVAKANAVESAD